MNTFWHCSATWRQAAHNTKWCLLGCSIGDFGTIAFFQFTEHQLSTVVIFMLAMMNGLLTSIVLETIILMRQKMAFMLSLRTAMGMSFISMLAMELAMNATDFLLTGGAMLTWWVMPIALFFGFITPLPYNYWRLKKWGKSCH